MGEMLLRENNLFWFVDESTSLMEYTDGDLASHIFDMVDRKLLGEQKDIVMSLAEASPAVAELVKGMRTSEHLRLVFSDEVKQKIADGTYRLMKRKDVDGVFKAVVVDDKGKIREIADLKWEEISNGVDLTEMTSAMQGMSIQQQLREISEQLQDMSAAIEDILMGQHNDRLAMFLSGEAIYREALSTSDRELKKSLISSAIMALTNASASLQASLVYEIDSVCSKYDREKGRFVGVKSDKLKEKMCLINSSFQTIHKANTLKAAIYYKEGEYQALTTVLLNYKAFLERSLTEDTAHILYLADPNEKTFDGIWNIRQNELPIRIDHIRELLMQPQNYSLEVNKEEITT